jgi:ABC-type transporter MlaC component
VSAVFAICRGCRRILSAVVLLILVAAFPLKPARANDAEDFIQSYIQQGLVILNDKSLSRDEQHKKFQALLEPITDMRRVALYALGPAAKTASPADVEVFVKGFHDLELSLYERELGRWRALKVENSIERAPGDTIVQAYLLDSEGRRSVNADEIDFRVARTADKPIILDFCVRGAWIAVNQHVQYEEFLAQRGNTLAKLNKKLINRSRKMNRW